MDYAKVQDVVFSTQEPFIPELATVGIDLAKSVFQIDGVDETGRVLVRRQLRCNQMLAFCEKQPRCLIDVEACAGAHD